MKDRKKERKTKLKVGKKSKWAKLDTSSHPSPALRLQRGKGSEQETVQLARSSRSESEEADHTAARKLRAQQPMGKASKARHSRPWCSTTGVGAQCHR